MKIKDNVDLKELEKFGYKTAKTALNQNSEYMSKEFRIILGRSYEEVLYTVYIHMITREITAYNEETDNDDVVDDEMLDFLTEKLWRANLVEEVK